MIQAGQNTFTLPLHPRLTVIAGLGQLERDSLLGELIGALGPSRSGVHAEVALDDGRQLAVFRPEGGRHRIVDIATATDVTSEFAINGRVDLLAGHGLDTRSARRRLRLSSQDLTTGSRGAALVRTLADVDQVALWQAADAMRRTDDELQEVAEAAGSTPEDAEVVDRVEQRHTALEAAQERHEGFRRKSMAISIGSALGAVPTTLVMPLAAFPLLLIASVSVLISVVYRSRVEHAARAEEAALASAGAESYLGFQIQRVNGLLSSDQQRKRLVGAAETHRAAAAQWLALAGDISVEWAYEHREEIVATARLRRDVASLGTMSSTAPEVDDDQTTDLAHVLVSRLAALRHLGADGESFPLVLDDPFVGLDTSMKPSLLELLGHTAGSPQLIYLTEDEEVASWARLEALTGALGIVEPRPESAKTNTVKVPRPLGV